MSLREDLIQSAVEFLKDSSISDSPLTKRIEFLESKGLTQEEIQEALKRAQQQQDKQRLSSSQAINNSVVSPDYYPNAPPVPDRDWKDYFIMATATVGVTYGIYQIVSRYLLPNILPPSKTKIEQEKESIDQEFSRVEKLLENLELKQNEFIEENNAKAVKIDETLSSIDTIISKTNEKNLQNEESLKYLKLEVENIKNTMVSNLDSQKSTVLQELTKLESELNELKSIILQTDIGIVNKSEIQLRPEEKLDRFKIPPASSVPSAVDILQTDSAEVPEWKKYADKVQQDALQEQSSGIPAWQQAATKQATESLQAAQNDDESQSNSSSTKIEDGAASKAPQGIPAWQLRS